MSVAAAPRPRVFPWRALAGWVVFIAVETITQIVFKSAGSTLDDRLGIWAMVARAAASPLVWGAFALYFLGFVIWLTILKDVDMGRAFPMTGMIYLATLTAAVLLFHEHLNGLRILGVLAIAAGVIMLASDEDSGPKPALTDGGPLHG